MYGSMTTIILIMLWLYGCMYIILLGGELNALLERTLYKQRERIGKPLISKTNMPLCS